MRIRERLSTGRPSFSFEFFPPKTPEGRNHLIEAILALRDLEPTYISVTYGAGGSTRDLTIDLVTEIKRDHGIETMAHLTCVGASRQELGGVIGRLMGAGIENILALRGDPPKGETTFTPPPDGFAYASELTGFIRKSFPVGVAGACYPEKHIECASSDDDLENLKRKVEAGCEF